MANHCPTQEPPPITILAVSLDHGLSFARRKLGPWSEFPFLYRFTALLNSGVSNSPWSEFWFVRLSFLILWGWGWFLHRQIIRIFRIFTVCIFRISRVFRVLVRQTSQTPNVSFGIGCTQRGQRGSVLCERACFCLLSTF